MSSDCYHQNPLNLLRAGVAFLATVIFSTVFLIKLDNVGEMRGPMAGSAAESAVAAPLEMPVAMSTSLVFATEPLCLSPDMEWALADDRCEDTAPVIPDRLSRQQKKPYQGIIVQVAGRYQVDPYLIRAIIFAESGFNPKATSKKGARGLMQLMPSTAKALGVEDIYDPIQNIDGGVRYFKSLLDRFDGNVQLALAAYNAGSRHVRNYEGVPPFKATRHYIKKVLKFHKKFKMETASLGRRWAYKG